MAYPELKWLLEIPGVGSYASSMMLKGSSSLGDIEFYALRSSFDPTCMVAHFVKMAVFQQAGSFMSQHTRIKAR